MSFTPLPSFNSFNNNSIHKHEEGIRCIHVKKRETDKLGRSWDKRACTNVESTDYSVVVTANKNLKIFAGKDSAANDKDIIVGDIDLWDEVNQNYIARFRQGILDEKVFHDYHQDMQKLAKFSVDTRGVEAGNGWQQIANNKRIDRLRVCAPNYGFTEDGAKGEPCRLTSYAANDERKEYLRVLKVVEAVDECYKKLMPAEHEKQWQEAHKSDFFLPNTKALKILTENKKTDVNPAYFPSTHEMWTYENGVGTSFSTFSVNGDFQTKYHKDKGDFEDGFGNLTVFRSKKEDGQEYQGFYTVMPEYVDEKGNAYAFDLSEKDFLAMNVHTYHGNSEPDFDTSTAAVVGKPKKRISLVCYLKQKMNFCPTSQKKKILPFVSSHDSLSNVSIENISFNGPHGNLKLLYPNANFTLSFVLKGDIDKLNQELNNKVKFYQEIFNRLIVQYTNHEKKAQPLLKLCPINCNADLTNTGLSIQLGLQINDRKFYNHNDSIRPSQTYPYNITFRTKDTDYNLLEFTLTSSSIIPKKFLKEINVKNIENPKTKKTKKNVAQKVNSLVINDPTVKLPGEVTLASLPEDPSKQPQNKKASGVPLSTLTGNIHQTENTSQNNFTFEFKQKKFLTPSSTYTSSNQKKSVL